MSVKELFRYGLRYAAIYVGTLIAIVIVVGTAANLFEFATRDMSIGAFIAAAIFTYNQFLKDHESLPNFSEYWSLVLLCTAIVVAIDILLALIILHPIWAQGFNLFIISLMIGIPVLKGLIGHCIIFSNFFGKRTLKWILKERAKKVSHDSH